MTAVRESYREPYPCLLTFVLFQDGVEILRDNTPLSIASRAQIPGVAAHGSKCYLFRRRTVFTSPKTVGQLRLA